MIKILIVDDQRLILEAVKAVLKNESQIEIVGTAQNGRTAISQVARLQPDIVLIDIEMPKMNGIIATKYISQQSPDTKVIVLTSHKSDTYVTKALQAGASSYLLKNTLIRDLKQAIYSLSRGYSYIETKILDKTVNQIRASNIVRSKTIYVRRHKKNIYSPSSTSSKSPSLSLQPAQQKFKSISKPPESVIKKPESVIRKSGSGISKATLAPIFESSGIKDILAADYLAPSKAKTIRRNYQKNKAQKLRRKAIIWLIAIASFILSIFIF